MEAQARGRTRPPADEREDSWQIRTGKAFNLETEIANQRASGEPYLEFLRVPALSCGIYSLPAGSDDLQAPHDEDEVYYVISGRGQIRVDGEQQAIGAGSILFVRATSEHSFFEIEEDLTLLVFFGPGQ